MLREQIAIRPVPRLLDGKARDLRRGSIEVGYTSFGIDSDNTVIHAFEDAGEIGLHLFLLLQTVFQRDILGFQLNVNLLKIL